MREEWGIVVWGVETVGWPTATRRYGVEQGGIEGFWGVPGLRGLGQ